MEAEDTEVMVVVWVDTEASAAAEEVVVGVDLAVAEVDLVVEAASDEVGTVVGAVSTATIRTTATATMATTA